MLWKGKEENEEEEKILESLKKQQKNEPIR